MQILTFFFLRQKASRVAWLTLRAVLAVCVLLAFGSGGARAQTKTAGLQEPKVLYAENEYARAIEILTPLSGTLGETSSPANAAEIFRLLGLSRYALGEYNLAAAALRRAFAADSSSLPTLHALGRVEKTLGAAEAARRAFERALSIDSTNRTTLELYATLCADEERFAEAAALLERLVATEPRNAGARLNLARVYGQAFSAAGRASAEFAALAKNNYLLALDLLPLNRQIRLEAARFLFTANDFLGTLGVLDRGIKAFPNDAALWRKKADAHNRLNQPSEAAYGYERSIMLGDSSAANFRELGVMYCRLQRFDSARRALLTAVENSPPEARTTSFLALAFRELGDFDNALAWCNATLTALQRPQFAGVFVQIGYVHRKAKAHEKARESYQLALEVDSANLEARFELATLLDEAAQETLKTDARKSAQNRRLAVGYYKRFLMGLTSDSLPTAQYAVRRLRELGETPPNFADLRRKTNDEAAGDKTATEISPRADSAAVFADSAFDNGAHRIRFIETGHDSTARRPQSDALQPAGATKPDITKSDTTKPDTTTRKSGER